MKRKTEAQERQLQKVITETCRVYGINRKKLRSRWKPEDVTLARKTIMHIAAERIGLTLRECVRAVGKRDHTSAIYAIRTSTDMLKNNEKYSENFKKVICKLNSHYC